MAGPPSADDHNQGVHAELAVSPSGSCPVAPVLQELDVREFLAPYGDGPPQLVVTREQSLPSVVEPVATTDELTVCRFTGPVADCSVDGCPVCSPGSLPVDPHTVEWHGERVHLHVAATGSDELRDCLEHLRESGQAAEPVGVASTGANDEARRVVVDLSRLTDRQRELGRLAVAVGYFDPEGPSAASLAADLEINKATLSEHLRKVQQELARQVFVGHTGDAT